MVIFSILQVSISIKYLSLAFFNIKQEIIWSRWVFFLTNQCCKRGHLWSGSGLGQGVAYKQQLRVKEKVFESTTAFLNWLSAWGSDITYTSSTCSRRVTVQASGSSLQAPVNTVYLGSSLRKLTSLWTHIPASLVDVLTLTVLLALWMMAGD